MLEILIQMQGQLKIIQDQLNKLCSQHDELMALLDIYDYIPTLRSLQQTNRTIYSRITLFEQEIEDLLQTSSTIKTREEIHLRTKQQQFKTSMQNTEMQIQELNRKIEQQKQCIKELEEGTAMTRRIVSQKESTRRKAEQLLHEFQEQSARLVAGQTVNMREVSMGQRSGGQQTKIQELLNEVVTDQMYSYQKLQHQIELMQLQMPIPPFQQFLEFTHSNLKSEILQTNQKALNLQTDLSNEHRQIESSKNQNSAYRGELTLLNRKYMQLLYRVKGLKRYCCEQLMFLYSKTQNKIDVCEIEGYSKQKIKELDHLLCILKNNLNDEAERQQ